MKFFITELFFTFARLLALLSFTLLSLAVLVKSTPVETSFDTFFKPLHNYGLTATPWAQSAAQRSLPRIETAELVNEINDYRVHLNLPPFSSDFEACADFEMTSTDPAEMEDEEIFGVCHNCIKALLVQVSSIGTPDAALAEMLESQATSEAFQDANYSMLCTREKENTIFLFTAVHADTDGKQPAVTSRETGPAPTHVKQFTEDELWQALVDYRHAHRKPDLIRDEKLCQYARERVEEHIQNFSVKSVDEYPNPDKYPLDAHAGFVRDAESGYAFEITDMKELAENLAYWPTAQYPHHVIEWGWDTSTEGHREAQLTEHYEKACLASGEGFFVALFGR